ncbi:aliphatic nitrilase [Diplodia corticola]|uniref:nitrilase n=1 Tax=Diplodia corticola TaxID=236234 RepID=A0A1J9R0C2_9PEZI|nr:aliphatic nitrilase [Diplodia corticola]OJD34072.1 aliphatic nitrilase [Diplodia corticola]
MASSLRVAVTQAEPEWLDLAATVKKTCDLIATAAANGARLIAFPECWITGYPGWIWARPVDFELTTKYIYNSLSLTSPEMDEIKSAAKRHSIAVVLGFSERVHTHSLYISQAIISPAGEVVMTRRKIKPTHVERAVFGDGSGDDLRNVAEIDFGGAVGKLKVGALACWEHTQPLLKYHTYSQGEVIHIAAWPPIDAHPGVEHPGLWSMSAEGCQNLSQTYAVEGGGYVLHCTGVCTEKGRDVMGTHKGLLFHTPGGGSSCVVGPDGRKLTDPLHSGDPAKEGIVYADLDLTKVVANRAFLDNVGHYSRPDLLWLGVDRKQKSHVIAREDEEPPKKALVTGPRREAS